MMLPYKYVTVCCVLVLFAACKKTDNDNKSAKRQLLEGGKWQRSATTATTNYMGVDTTIDLYAELEECDKDDFMIFAGDGSATLDENTNKCAKDPQIQNAQWVLLDNDTKIVIIDSNPDTMALEITSAQMELTLVKPNTSGTTVTYLYTYKNIK